MYSRTLFLAALTAGSAVATIYIGHADTGNNVVAWIDLCNDGYVLIGDVVYPDNPCGVSFETSNGYNYTLQGCGTSDFALYNSDGSYNHACVSAPDDWQDCQDSDDEAVPVFDQDWMC